MKKIPDYTRTAASILFLLQVMFFVKISPVLAQDFGRHEAEVYVTAKASGNLMAREGNRAFEDLAQPDENYPTIILDGTKTFQTIVGFGGAFTDAAAKIFAALSSDEKERFLKACFDSVAGSGYTLCRTTINSCDYSDEMYTYDDVPGDTALNNFSIAHELKFRFPLIRRAEEVSGGKLKLFASPWSPPAWMKTNGNMLYGGRLKPEYYRAWADYFVKYLQACSKYEIPIWGITVQNEPMAVQVWESCVYTADEEKDFVKTYLGPALQKNGSGDIRLMIWDHNRGIMYQRAGAAYEDPAASKYIWGTAFHWYVGEHFDNVRMVHDAFPDKHLLFTEGSTAGSWEAGWQLAENMINDLNNWAEGWVYWNLLLDQYGGPRHAGGLEGANIITADSASGKVIFNPPFYYFEHFSKFVRPGARRIACTSNDDELIATAFINPDGRTSAIVFNRSECEKNFQVWISGRVIKRSLPAKGITTIVF